MTPNPEAAAERARDWRCDTTEEFLAFANEAEAKIPEFECCARNECYAPTIGIAVGHIRTLTARLSELEAAKASWDRAHPAALEASYNAVRDERDDALRRLSRAEVVIETARPIAQAVRFWRGEEAEQVKALRSALAALDAENAVQPK